MKENNIKQLKEMVNANDLEVIESVKYGVQAYGISANEYEVITKFAKITAVITSSTATATNTSRADTTARNS